MWYNIPIAWLLRSPLHGLLGSSLLLITVSGRKSGKQYSTPVNFIEDGGTIWVTSQVERTWWRNLRGGARLQVVIKGKTSSGWGEAIEEADAVIEGLSIYLRKTPAAARYFAVQLDSAGAPLEEDLRKAACRHVMIKIKLEQET